MTGLDAKQFLQHVVQPVLQRMDLYSKAAEQLVIGTAAHESRLTYLHQVNGPALGLYQIEPATHSDLWQNWLMYRSLHTKLLRQFCPDVIGVPAPETLIWNLGYATAVCRLIYARVPTPLPEAGDFVGMANYWKDHYNTVNGKGNVDDWLLHFPVDLFR